MFYFVLDEIIVRTANDFFLLFTNRDKLLVLVIWPEWNKACICSFLLLWNVFKIIIPWFYQHNGGNQLLVQVAWWSKRLNLVSFFINQVFGCPRDGGLRYLLALWSASYHINFVYVYTFRCILPKLPVSFSLRNTCVPDWS